MAILVRLMTRLRDRLEDFTRVRPRARVTEYAVARNIVFEEVLEWLVDKADLPADFGSPRVLVHFAVLLCVLLEDSPRSGLVRAFGALHVQSGGATRRGG